MHIMWSVKSKEVTFIHLTILTPVFQAKHEFNQPEGGHLPFPLKARCACTDAVTILVYHWHSSHWRTPLWSSNIRVMRGNIIAIKVFCLQTLMSSLLLPIGLFLATHSCIWSVTPCTWVNADWSILFRLPPSSYSLRGAPAWNAQRQKFTHPEMIYSKHVRE